MKSIVNGKEKKKEESRDTGNVEARGGRCMSNSASPSSPAQHCQMRVVMKKRANRKKQTRLGLGTNQLIVRKAVSRLVRLQQHYLRLKRACPITPTHDQDTPPGRKV